MTTTAQSIVLDVQTALQDPDGVRWPAAELVRHIDTEQREIARLRPDAAAATEVIGLASGTRQVLPSKFMVLIDIPRNAGASRRSIRKADQVQLDAVDPDWHNGPASQEIVHFLHDQRDPRTFFVWPPAAGARVEIVASRYPAPLPDPTGPTSADVTGNIDLEDCWKQALIDGVLHHAYAKDAEYGGNAELSVAHLTKRNSALQSQLQAATSVAPQS